MADLFDQLDAPTAAAEGGYVNHPSDKGGETNWGVTAVLARSYGYTGSMRDLPRETAKAIRRTEFWVRPGLHLIAPLSTFVASELYDTAVNGGAVAAATMFQRALNALNRQGVDYPDLKVDGQLGPATAAAFQVYLGKRGTGGERVMLKALNCLQGARYIDLAEARPANEDFVFGWLDNRVTLGG